MTLIEYMVETAQKDALGRGPDLKAIAAQLKSYTVDIEDYGVNRLHFNPFDSGPTLVEMSGTFLNVSEQVESGFDVVLRPTFGAPEIRVYGLPSTEAEVVAILLGEILGDEVEQ